MRQDHSHWPLAIRQCSDWNPARSVSIWKNFADRELAHQDATRGEE